MFKNTSMAKSWIALRAGWKLEDVQAALNVVISMLSTMGIFVFARFCWHETAARVDRSQNVRLSSLLISRANKRFNNDWKTPWVVGCSIVCAVSTISFTSITFIVI